MIKFNIALIAATVAVAVSAPAFAGQIKAKIVQKNGQTYYCVTEKATGMLAPERTCLTKADWEARGAKIAMAKNSAQLASNGQATNQN